MDREPSYGGVVMADGFWFGVLIGWLANTIALLILVLFIWVLTRLATPTIRESQ